MGTTASHVVMCSLGYIFSVEEEGTAVAGQRSLEGGRESKRGKEQETEWLCESDRVTERQRQIDRLQADGDTDGHTDIQRVTQAGGHRRQGREAHGRKSAAELWIYAKRVEQRRCAEV